MENLGPPDDFLIIKIGQNPQYVMFNDFTVC